MCTISKPAYDDIKRYMLKAGMPECLLEGGSYGHVHEVGDHWFEMVLPCGEKRTYHVDLQLPSSPSHGLWSGWKKQLNRCLARSSPVKLFGASRILGREWRLTEQSLIVSQCARFDTKQMKLYEMYSGGFGGWSRGAKWLNQQYMPVTTVGAADWDPFMVTQWNMNHAIMDSDNHVMCKCLDARDIENWDEIAKSGANTVSLSSSCRSFSLAGGQAGWDSIDGQGLALSLAYCQAVGCQAILLENVANLANNKVFQEFLDRILEFLGLKFVFATVCNISHLHAAERSRLLAIIQPMNASVVMNPLSEDWSSRLKQYQHQTLWEQQRWVEPPSDIIRDIMLDQETLDLYASPGHLPSGMKQSIQVMNKDEILEARRVRSQHQMPAGCIMAAYTKQHDLALSTSNPTILGKLRKDQQGWRFFHPTETAIATGIAMPLTVSNNVYQATVAIGNMISECHAIMTLASALHMLSSHLDIAQIPTVEEFLNLHKQQCLRSDTIQWFCDDQWITISRYEEQTKNATMIDSDEPFKTCTIVPSVGDEVEPACVISVARGSTIGDLIQAEEKLHGMKRSFVGAFGTDSSKLSEHDKIDEDEVLLLSHERKDIQSKGVVCHWTDGACWFGTEPHQPFAGITIAGIGFTEVPWTDVDGQPIDPQGLCGFHQHVFTKSTFGWNQIKKANSVKVIVVEHASTSSFHMDHGPEEDVESLLLAQQVLLGPFLKITKVQDSMARDLPANTRLSEVPIVVIHVVSSHGKLRVTMTCDDKSVEHWVEKGTRLFQLHPPTTGQIPVDHLGIELPWDLPFYQNIHVTIIHPSEEVELQSDDEVSPTVPFSLNEANTQEMIAQAPDLSISALVRQSIDQIQSRLQSMLAPDTSAATAMFIQDRLLTLCQRGPAVGDDKMGWFLHRLIKTGSHKVYGTFHWDEQVEGWLHDYRWNQALSLRPCQPVERGVLAVCFHQHWIPMFVNIDDGTKIYYHCEQPLEKDVLVDLGIQIWGPKPLEFMHLPRARIHGWCGFQSMQWIALLTNLQIDYDDQDDHSDLIQNLEKSLSATVIESYARAMRVNDHSLDGRFIQQVRDDFIRQQLISPSQPIYHGMGDKEPMSNLKAIGKLAAVLIGRAHPQEEAMRIAKHITDDNLPLAKSIVSQKDNRAYGMILEYCAKNSIETQQSKTDAAQRLQQWFRTKYAKKQKKLPEAQSLQIDLAQVIIKEKSFMVRNGEYLSIQAKWSPAIRGISISTQDEIDKYLANGEVLSPETNAALILEDVRSNKAVEATRTTIQVEDASGNTAIIQATIVNFGERKVVRVPPKDASVDTIESSVLSLQVYQHDLHADDWQRVQASPAKLLMQQLQADKQKTPVISLWSRRWMVGFQNANPKTADTFSCLIAIPEEDVQTWLQLSGMTTIPVYVSQKRQQDNQSTYVNHRVVWVSKNLGDAQASIGRLSEHSGIVHKPPNQYGIRVRESLFADSWIKIKGEDSDIPSQVQTNHRYILDGIPPTINGQKLQEWGEEMNWELRVLRKYSNQRYLIGTSTPKPEGELSINGKQILVIEHADQSKKPHSIIVGRLQCKSPSTTDGDLMQKQDPWHGVQLGSISRPSTTAGDAWKAYRPTTSATSSHGSTSEPHTQRIVALEQEMQVLKDTVQSHHAENKSKFSTLEREIGAVSTDLKTSMANALAEQSKTLISTFETLLKKSPRHGKDQSRSRSLGRGSGP